MNLFLLFFFCQIEFGKKDWRKKECIETMRDVVIDVYG